jgi:hypothetical protein
MANWYSEVYNVDDLLTFVAAVTGKSISIVKGYYDELQGDVSFREELLAGISTTSEREHRICYGKRIIWYCIIRIEKPEICVETGVHDGLGSAVILQALYRNSLEGVDGLLYSFDVPAPDLPADIKAVPGWLVPFRLRNRYILTLGKSLDTMPILFDDLRVGDLCVDFFIHDSDHSKNYELKELNYVWGRVRDNGLVMSDNAHGSAFSEFAKSKNLKFSVFDEKNRDGFIGEKTGAIRK